MRSSTRSAFPDWRPSQLLNSIEPPWYGPVCPVVWEGRSREAPPYPDLCNERRNPRESLPIALTPSSPCAPRQCGPSGHELTSPGANDPAIGARWGRTVRPGTVTERKGMDLPSLGRRSPVPPVPSHRVRSQETTHTRKTARRVRKCLKRSFRHSRLRFEKAD